MRLKTDVRDCFAVVELLTRGQGWPFYRYVDTVVSQQLWIARRRRTLLATQPGPRDRGSRLPGAD